MPMGQPYGIMGQLQLATSSGRRSQATPELMARAREMLLGGGAKPAVPSVPKAAPKKQPPSLARYPDAPDDPALAAYGSGHEGLMGKGMTAYMGRNRATPEQVVGSFNAAATMGLPDAALAPFSLRPEANPAAAESNARAQIAANRSALVALGYDPRNTVFTHEDPRHAAGGAYGRTLGNDMQVNAQAGAPFQAHESMHAGFERLDPAGLPAPLQKTLGQPGMEELLVRMAMQQQFGDAEAGYEQGIGLSGNHKQITTARKMLEQPYWQDALGKLERRAAEQIAARRPGGPR